MVVVEKVRFKISNKNIRMYGVSKSTPLKLNQMILSKIKKMDMPVHGCIDADKKNGLSLYSMVLGEQPQTISKNEVIDKLGTVTDHKDRNMINKVCFNTFFYGEDINWKEVFGACI